MEAGASKTHRIVIVVAGVVALAVISVVAISIHAQRVEHARIAAQLDDLSKRVATLQGEIATEAPEIASAPALHDLADASVGDFPLPPKAKLQVQPKDPPAPTATRGGGDPGY